MQVYKPDLFEIDSFEMFVNHVNFSELKLISLSKKIISRCGILIRN